MVKLLIEKLVYMYIFYIIHYKNLRDKFLSFQINPSTNQIYQSPPPPLLHKKYIICKHLFISPLKTLLLSSFHGGNIQAKDNYLQTSDPLYIQRSKRKRTGKHIKSAASFHDQNKKTTFPLKIVKRYKIICRGSNNWRRIVGQ